MATDEPDDHDRANERTEGESGEPLQRYLNEAARPYLARCEPLQPPPADGVEVIWLVGLPGAGKTRTGELLSDRERLVAGRVLF